ncbi:MAG: hypothetical protein HZA49_00740 [Planctomycetes bacterium]|nr:hypothetical protein [Planctomycetota bacterium]
MENNELKQPKTKEPPRFVTLLLLGLELVPIILVSLILITITPQFIRIFKGLGMDLPFITRAFLHYWYLWVIFLGVLFMTGILLEIFAKGKWRWVNFSLSIFTMLLCGLIFLGYITAVFQPIFAIQQAVNK